MYINIIRRASRRLGCLFENFRFSIIFQLPGIYLTHCLIIANHQPPFDLFNESERSRRGRRRRRSHKPIIIKYFIQRN